jgi:cytoskeleton protein RodZ
VNGTVPKAVDEAVTQEPLPQSEEAVPPASSLSVLLGQAEDSTVIEDAPSPDDLVVPGSEIVSDTESSKIVSAPASTALPETGQIDSPATADTAISSPLIQVEFTDTCWVEIRDSDGAFRVVGERKAGSRIVFDGKAPYRILFGNAAAAHLTIDGEPFDLGPHTRGNVSRFTLALED